ncbi:hypothetical protein H8E07_03585, partial [bacterium]|nr:hypothetical protein [bacterium]
MNETPDNTAPRKRADVPDHHKWDLSRIFAGWDAWEAAFRAVDASLEPLPSPRGTLGGSGAALLRLVVALHDGG